jgi:hypothetical protein
MTWSPLKLALLWNRSKLFDEIEQEEEEEEGIIRSNGTLECCNNLVVGIDLKLNWYSIWVNINLLIPITRSWTVYIQEGVCATSIYGIVGSNCVTL